MLTEITKIPAGIYRFFFGDLSLWGALAISVLLVFIYMVINGKNLFSRFIQVMIILSIILMARTYYHYEGLMATIKFIIFISVVFFAPTIIKYLYKLAKALYKTIKEIKAGKKSADNNLKMLKLLINRTDIQDFLDSTNNKDGCKQEPQKFVIKDLPCNPTSLNMTGGDKPDEKIS